MQNNQNPAPANIQEALDRLVDQPANPPPTPENVTIEKIMDEFFIKLFEINPYDRPLPLPLRPHLHINPPGRGATWWQWGSFLRAEAMFMIPDFNIDNDDVPLPVTAWVLQRCTPEEKESFVNLFRPREGR